MKFVQKNKNNLAKYQILQINYHLFSFNSRKDNFVNNKLERNLLIQLLFKEVFKLINVNTKFKVIMIIMMSNKIILEVLISRKCRKMTKQLFDCLLRIIS
jgi:hypothetical protein